MTDSPVTDEKYRSMDLRRTSSQQLADYYAKPAPPTREEWQEWFKRIDENGHNCGRNPDIISFIIELRAEQKKRL